MKEGWKYCALSDCCNINYGTRVVRSKVSGSKYPVYGGGGETFRMDDYNRENCLVVARFAMSKQCARVVKGKFFLNDSGLTVSPKEASKLLPLLVEKYLLASNDIIYSFGRGSAQRNLNMAEFRSMVFSYPESLTEQQRIVEYLDASFAEIDALKAKAAEEVANAKAMFVAALREEMTPKEGWEEKALKDIGDSKVGPFGSLLHKSDYIVGGIPLINPMHIVNGCIKADSNFSINKEKYNELQAFVMKEGDVVIARRGEMGRCAVVNSNQSGYLCGTGSIFYRPNKSLVNSVFLQLLISSENIKKEIVKIAGGATMLNLSSRGLNSLTISIPQIEIQQRIVAKLDTLRSHLTELEQKYNLIAANCDALKQAILRETFE